MFVILKKENDQLVEAATTEDKAAAEKLMALLSKQWPAESSLDHLPHRTGPLRPETTTRLNIRVEWPPGRHAYLCMLSG